MKHKPYRIVKVNDRGSEYYKVQSHLIFGLYQDCKKDIGQGVSCRVTGTLEGCREWIDRQICRVIEEIEGYYP